MPGTFCNASVKLVAPVAFRSSSVITLITAGALLAVRFEAVAIVVSRLIRSSRLKEIKCSSLSSVPAKEADESEVAKHRPRSAEFKRNFVI